MPRVTVTLSQGPIPSKCDQVSRDQRSQLKRELRDRGLNNVHAIRQILDLEPATIPRPDTRSTVALPGSLVKM